MYKTVAVYIHMIILYAALGICLGFLIKSNPEIFCKAAKNAQDCVKLMKATGGVCLHGQ